MIAPLYWYKEHGKGSWEQELGGHLNLEKPLLVSFFPPCASICSLVRIPGDGALGGKREETHH